MIKEFVSYEQALELKELGFDESCFAEYRQWDGNIPYLAIYQDDSPEDVQPFTTECPAPLYQQAFRWFREKHKLFGTTYPYTLNNKFTWIIRDISKNNISYIDQTALGYLINEEAELACLNEMIKIIKNHREK